VATITMSRKRPKDHRLYSMRDPVLVIDGQVMSYRSFSLVVEQDDDGVGVRYPMAWGHGGSFPITDTRRYEASLLRKNGELLTYHSSMITVKLSRRRSGRFIMAIEWPTGTRYGRVPAGAAHALAI
jgi:hypothetical protein